MSQWKRKVFSKKIQCSKNKSQTDTRDYQNMFEIFLYLHIIAIVSDFSFESKNPSRKMLHFSYKKSKNFLKNSTMFSYFLRGIMFTLGCILTLLISSGIVNAASGGKFAEILWQILGITPDQVLTYAGDGTVANANKLGWLPASNFQKVAPSQSCPATKCIYWFDTSGNVMCR